jgi:hypothetical protein
MGREVGCEYKSDVNMDVGGRGRDGKEGGVDFIGWGCFVVWGCFVGWGFGWVSVC